MSDFLRAREGKFGYRCSYESEKLKYVLEATYTPDFIIRFEDGHKIYLETKGYFDQIAKRKMVAVKKCNPDLDIRFLFSRNNILYKGAKSKYSDWCNKYGFPWAIRDIPIEWLTRNKEETN